MASTQNVPAGHHNSDLSSAVCNIGLNRRRDITLRQDIEVVVHSKTRSLADVFKVRTAHGYLRIRDHQRGGALQRTLKLVPQSQTVIQ
jgi:hypothetical protein